MPGPSGLELQKVISLPVVFLTGRGDIESSVRAMKAGAVDFLTKPVEPAELLKAIRAALERDRTVRGQRETLSEERMRYGARRVRQRGVFGLIDARRCDMQIGAALD